MIIDSVVTYTKEEYEDLVNALIDVQHENVHAGDIARIIQGALVTTDPKINMMPRLMASYQGRLLFRYLHDYELKSLPMGINDESPTVRFVIQWRLKRGK
jgi:hypothetical protein